MSSRGAAEIGYMYFCICAVEMKYSMNIGCKDGIKTEHAHCRDEVQTGHGPYR